MFFIRSKISGEFRGIFHGYSNHIGHHKRGANLPDFPIRFGQNPAETEALFDGFRRNPMQGPVGPYRLRE